MQSRKSIYFGCVVGTCNGRHRIGKEQKKRQTMINSKGLEMSGTVRRSLHQMLHERNENVWKY